MTEDERLAKWFEFWEMTIQKQMVVSKTTSEGLDVVKIGGSKPKEWWLSQYVLHNPKRLGFTAVEGPFDRGPDLQVKKGGKWCWAEVEFNWKKYRHHKHHLSAAFSKVRYLIVLSAAKPSPEEAQKLPTILHINEEHFATWVAKAKDEYRQHHQPAEKLNLRKNLISNALTAMLFGEDPEDSDGNDIPFDRIAVDFLEAYCLRNPKAAEWDGNRWDLTKATRPLLWSFLLPRVTAHCQMQRSQMSA